MLPSAAQRPFSLANKFVFNMAYWITLPHEWKLQDVQAALNVIITALSALTIFAFTRFCWQLGVHNLVRKNAVATSSLLTLNTPGEVFESIIFLKAHLLWHTKIFVQCLVITVFALVTLFSGPIARYSTRMTQTVIQKDVDGLLASRYDNSMADTQHTWNLTMERLIEADFPTTQVLDYIPDLSNDWVYHPEEWNNSWTLSCKPSKQTAFEFSLTNNCTTFQSEFEDMIQKVIPMGPNSDYFYADWSDYYENSTYVKDLLMFVYAANYTNLEEESDHYRTIDMAIGAVHAHGPPKNGSDDAECWYAEGPVEEASYTRVDCTITRTNASIVNTDLIAYPDTGDVSAIPAAYLSNYFARFKYESMSDSDITLMTPEDLLRFYQTYMITKDTQNVMPVKRLMSVEVPAVQVAALFVAIFALLFVFVCLGASSYILFWLWHRKALETVPQSKLDWLVHSIASTPTPTHSYFHTQDQKSATAYAAPAAPDRGDRRAQFEAAVFSVNSGVAVASAHAQTVYQPPQQMPAHFRIQPAQQNATPGQVGPE
jgi:hypothetical protein